MTEQEFEIDFEEVRYYTCRVKIKAEDYNKALEKFHNGDYDDTFDVEVIEYTTNRK